MAASTPLPRRTTPRFAFPALILANIILPLGPVLVRLSDVGPVAAAFWRLTLALPFLFLFALPGLKAARPGARDVGAMLLAGLFFAADLAAWHLGIPLTKVTNATIFGNMSALLLPLWGLLVLRQRPRPMQAAALLLAALGAAIMMGGSYELSPAICAATCSACSPGRSTPPICWWCRGRGGGSTVGRCCWAPAWPGCCRCCCSRSGWASV